MQSETQINAQIEAADLQDEIGYGTVSAASSNNWKGAYAIIDFDTLHKLVGDRDRARKMLDVAGMALAEIQAQGVTFDAKGTQSKRVHEIASDALGALNELSAL